MFCFSFLKALCAKKKNKVLVHYKVADNSLQGQDISANVNMIEPDEEPALNVQKPSEKTMNSTNVQPNQFSSLHFN